MHNEDDLIFDISTIDLHAKRVEDILQEINDNKDLDIARLLEMREEANKLSDGIKKFIESKAKEN